MSNSKGVTSQLGHKIEVGLSVIFTNILLYLKNGARLGRASRNSYVLYQMVLFPVILHDS